MCGCCLLYAVSSSRGATERVGFQPGCSRCSSLRLGGAAPAAAAAAECSPRDYDHRFEQVPDKEVRKKKWEVGEALVGVCSLCGSAPPLTSSLSLSLCFFAVFAIASSRLRSPCALVPLHFFKRLLQLQFYSFRLCLPLLPLLFFLLLLLLLLSPSLLMFNFDFGDMGGGGGHSHGQRSEEGGRGIIRKRRTTRSKL